MQRHPGSPLFPYTTLFRSMARIRRELHEDVRGVVESAEAVTDWKHWIRDYPWASVAAAAAVGFFLVPKRRRKGRSEEHTSELQSRQYLVCRLLLEKKKTRG